MINNIIFCTLISLVVKVLIHFGYKNRLIKHKPFQIYLFLFSIDFMNSTILRAITAFMHIQDSFHSSIHIGGLICKSFLVIVFINYNQIWNL